MCIFQSVFLLSCLLCCLCGCLSFWLAICISACLLVCPSVFPFLYPYIFLFIYLSIDNPSILSTVKLSADPHAHPSVYLSVCPPLRLFFHLPVDVFPCLSVGHFIDLSVRDSVCPPVDLPLRPSVVCLCVLLVFSIAMPLTI